MPIDAVLGALRAAFAPSPLDAKGAFAWEPDAELCERAVHGKMWDEVDLRVVARVVADVPEASGAG